MAVFVTRWAERRGYRGMLSIGAALLIAANAWFLTQADPEPSYWQSMFPGLMLFGVGMGFVFAPLNAAALVDVPGPKFSQANAAFNTVRSLAGALGIAAVVAALGNGGDVDVMVPFERAYGLLVAFSVVALVILLALWPRRDASAPMR
jgi:MFS family permease